MSQLMMVNTRGFKNEYQLGTDRSPVAQSPKPATAGGKLPVFPAARVNKVVDLLQGRMSSFYARQIGRKSELAFVGRSSSSPSFDLDGAIALQGTVIHTELLCQSLRQVSLRQPRRGSIEQVMPFAKRAPICKRQPA